MEELGGERASEGFDGRLLGWGEAGGGEFGECAGEFGLADLLGGLLEGEDGGDSISGLETLLVPGYFFGDDVFGRLRFPAAVGEVGLGDLLEVVDVVDEAAFDFVHAGVDVAGDGDVDEEHGAVAATLEEVLAVGAAEEFLGGTGGGDDDVGAGCLLVEVFVGDDGGGDGGVEEFGS